MHKIDKKAKNKFMENNLKEIKQNENVDSKEEKVKNISVNKIKIILLGVVTGFLSGLFGSGGGMIAVPGLVYLIHTSEKEARAIAIFSILPMTITSMIFYRKAGEIDFKLGALCGIGGIVGGIIGAKMLKKISDKYLVLIFIVFIIYASILLFNK